MKCPRHDQKLTYVRKDSNKFHACDSCKGVAVRKSDVPKLCKLTREVLDPLEQSELDCPRCSQRMKAYWYKGVEIDICPSCSTVWLDYGEKEGMTAAASRGTNMPWYGTVDFISPVIDFIFDGVSCLSDGI